MPPVIAVIQTIGALIPGIAAATTAATVAGTLIIASAALAIRSLIPKVDMGVVDTDRSRQTTVRSTIEPRKLVYGETMISGVVSFAQCDGANNKNLHQVIAIAGHKLTSIDKIFFDDYSIDLSTQVDGNGDVTSGKFAKKTNEDGTLETMVHIETRDGSSTQTAYSDLVTAFAGTGANAGKGYESTHRGDNVASIYTRWTIHEGSSETWDEVGGIQNIKAVVKGKAVYDPRLDVAADNEAGDNPTASAYVKYSDGATTATHQRDLQGQNPALMLADYLMDSSFGLGIPASKIDWPAVITAADACDYLVPIPTSQTQKRFFGSGVIFGSDNHRKSISKILSAMNGDLIYSQGKYIIKAGIHEASSLDLTEDDLAGDFTVKTSIPRADRFNTIKGMFIDPESKYKMTEFSPRTVSGAVARDNGEVLEEEIKLTFTSDRYVAQRIAIKKVNQSFLQTTLSLPVNLKGMKVAVGDRITLALNDFATIDADWNPSKEFKVIGWSFSESGNGAIDLSLIEDDEDRYADPAEGDYNQISNTGVIISSLAQVPSPKEFTATAGYNSVNLAWTNPTGIGTWEQIWIFASDTTTPPTTPIEKFRGTAFTHQIAGGTAKYYWIQAVKYPLGSTPASGATNTSKSALVPFEIDGSIASVTALKIANAVMATDSIDAAQIVNGAVGSAQINTTLESDNWSTSGGTAGWQILKSGAASFQTAVISGNISASTGTIGGFTVGSTDLIAGDEATRVSLSTADGISLGDNTFADAPFRVTPAGVFTATSGSIGNSVTVGGTAASTVASGAATGATASQVNAGLALLLNKDTFGNGNDGEASLVSVDKDGIPILETSSITSNGFIQWNGSKITVEAVQYTISATSKVTVLTGLSAKRGFIVFDTTKSNPFTVASVELDVAFAFKEGAQWYYDNNVTATTFTPTNDMVALGYLETGDGDEILKGGLINPVTLTAAAFPSDEIKSGSVGGININTSAIYSGSKSSFADTDQGFWIGSNGTMSFANGTANTLEFDTNGDLSVTGNITATSGTFDGTVNASAGAFTGDVSTDSKFIAGSGNATTVIDGDASAIYRIFSGAAQSESENAPFQVKPDGSVFAKNITVFDASGNILLDQNGLGAAALAGISLTSGTAVDKVSGVLSGNGGEMTLTLDQTATVTLETKFAIYDNSVGTLYLYGAGSTEAAAKSDITNSTLNIIYSLQTDGGSYSTAATKPITFTSTDSTPSNTEIYVTAVYIAGSIQEYRSILMDAGGALEYIANTNTYGATAYVVTSHTFTNLPAGVHKVKLSSTITGSGSPAAAGQSTSNRLYELTSSAINFVESSANVFANGTPSVPTGGGTVSGNLVVTGDLTVNGTTTTVNTDNLTVKDPNITLNYATGDSSSTANNAGITIQDAVSVGVDSSILWKTASDTFEFSHAISTKNATFDNGTNTTVDVIADDDGMAQIRLYGSNQGTGRLFVGQATNYGGGIEYNGDNSPVTSGAGSDYTALYRTTAASGQAGTFWTARNHVNSNDWEFSGAITWPSGSSTNANTAYTYSQVGHLPLAGGTLTGALAMGANAITSTGTISSGAITAPSFVGASFGAATGAPDSTIWAISRDQYPTYGIFYDEGNPDKILYKWNGVTKFNINMETGALDTPSTISSGAITSSGIITATGGTSTNWNTAYTYSQVGHLPLAGGTLTGSVSSSSNFITTGYLQAQYFNAIGGQEVILTGGESKSQLEGVTGGNPLQSEFVYAVAEGGLLVISSPDNWLDTGTTYYNDASWAKRHQTYINDSNGNSTFAGKVTAKTNYVYGGQNYHFILSEDTNPAYISNVAGDGLLTTGGYYYGAELRQLNSGSTAYSGIRVQQNGSFRIEQIVGATAGSTATTGIPLSIGTDGVTTITHINTGNVNANEVHGKNIGHVEQDYLFAITDWDTTESIRKKFGNTSTYFTKVTDSSAPASGVFQVAGDVNPQFGELIPLGEEDEIIFECWAKYVSGGDSAGLLYVGSSFFNGSQVYLGNNQRYWGANANELDSSNGSTWRHIRGVLNVENLRTVSAVSTAEYAQLLVLFNYQAGANTTRYCGFKFYRAKKSVTTLYHTGNSRGTKGFSADWEGTQTKIIDGSGNITSAGTFNSPIGTAIDESGNFYVPEYLYHKSDGDTFLRFLDNRIILKSGNVDAIDIHSNGNMYFHRTIIAYGQISAQAKLVVGTDDVATSSDANITIKEGDAFAGIDLKSLRTSGNIGGLRSYNADNSVTNELLLRVDGSINVSNSGGLRMSSTLFVDSSRNVTAQNITSGAITATGLTVSTASSVPTFDIITTHSSGIPILNLKGAASAQVRYQDENGNNQSRIDFNDAGAFNFIDATDGSSHLLINSSGNATFAGTISSGAITNSGVIRQTISNVGIPTLYSSFTMEATDAQMDLVSSSAGTWGSALNFVQGTSTTANTDVWSIVRKTTSGGNSLNFNFGTANQHDNTTQVSISTTGDITAGTISSGAITSTGASTFGSVTGSVLVSNIVDPGNPAAAADNLRLSGYGVMGNRGVMYFTNSNASGSIVFGISGVHNANPKLTLSTTGATFAGTISSGAITSSGAVSATEYDLPSSGKLDWANGDARIQEGLVNNYSLSFQTYDGSNLTTALRLDGDNAATFAGDILLDSSNAEINIKSGATGTSGAVNWTFNTTGTDYASLKLPYDTRNTTGFHIDSGYPITIDATTRIRFDISGNNKGDWDDSRLYVGSYIYTPYVDARYFLNKPLGAIRTEPINNIQNYGSQSEVLFDTTSILSNRHAGPAGPTYANNLTAADFSYNATAAGTGGSVIRTSAYRVLYSDYIPVTPGEVVFGEMWSRNISGTGGLIYFGIERFDSQKQPIAGNTGTSYFVVGGLNQTSTSWVRYSNSQRLPTSHTPFGGSDGGGVYYIRVRILLNHSTGGALREFSGIQLTRMNRMSTNLAFGHAGPWGGGQNGTRFAAIEGNTDAGGEGSGRLFFSEHNSSIAAADHYGMSFGYRGGATSIITTARNVWTGLSQIGNGCWGMWGHDADLTGALIMDGDRGATRINFNDNKLYLGSATSTTYLQRNGHYLKIQTASGYCNIGPANTSYSHFSTDRPTFYFNTGLIVDSGVFASYDEDLVLQRAQSATYKMTLSTSGATFTHNVTAYSDRRLKENIKPIQNALDTVLKLEGVTYKRIDNGENNLGFIAQQIEESAPEIADLVVGEMNDERKTKHVNYANMVALLTTAIQEQQDQINELKQTIEDMKNDTQ